MTDGTKISVFISYSRRDKAFADWLEQHLYASGANVFIDTKSLRAGDEYWHRIKHEIVQSDFFAAVQSKEGAKSNAVIDEINYATECLKKHGKPQIIPLRIDDSESIPLLSRLQYVDFVDWNRRGQNSSMLGFLKDIGLKPPSASDAEAALFRSNIAIFQKARASAFVLSGELRGTIYAARESFGPVHSDRHVAYNQQIRYINNDDNNEVNDIFALNRILHRHAFNGDLLNGLRTLISSLEFRKINNGESVIAEKLIHNIRGIGLIIDNISESIIGSQFNPTAIYEE